MHSIFAFINGVNEVIHFLSQRRAVHHVIQLHGLLDDLFLKVCVELCRLITLWGNGERLGQTSSQLKTRCCGLPRDA